MSEEKDKNKKGSAKKKSIEDSKEQTLEERKRAAYSAMGKLGGLARAKQMAEKGFVKDNKLTDELNSLGRKRKNKGNREKSKKE